MDTLVHADIFFFVTTIAVIVVAVAFTVVLFYLAKVLSDLKDITEHIKEETALFRGDIGRLRNTVQREGFRLEQFISFFRNAVKRKKTRSK